MKTLALALALCGTASGSYAQALAPSHAPTKPASATPRVYEVARVNGVALLSDRLAVVVNALLPLSSFHQNVDAAKQAEIRNKALQSLVDEELKFQAAARMGGKVTDAEVDAGLARAIKGYKTPEAFEASRKRSGATLSQVRAEIRRALKVEKTYASAVGRKCQVDEPAAAVYYKANAERFVMPEQLHVYLITIGVPPSGLKAEWEGGKKRAEDVLAQIRAGAEFEDLARTHSTDASKDKGGDMGLIHRGSLADDFERAAKDMKPGQVSEIIQTIYGYHLLRLAEIVPPVRRSFDEMKVQLQKDLTTKRCSEMSEAWVAQLRAAAKIVVLDDPKVSSSQAVPRSSKQ